MKHPDTGEWIPAVIYKVDGLEPLWCRSVESFKSILVMLKLKVIKFIYEKVNLVLFT